jgi:hypothetical protein
MAESKFTPGPYCVMGPSEEPSAAKRVFAETTYLGTVTNSDMDPEEIAANAELWADAPRMLEALRGIRDAGNNAELYLLLELADALLEKHGG